tara:strand:+ start:7716 stop:9011 length:1296 start_codon:yes stop_codon:yes gene_type:complete
MTEIYNSSITTRLIDPVFDKAKFRSEFRLQPETVYLSNLRLLNTGIDSGTTTDLNGLLGTYGCIKSIQLYDGNQLLDQLLQASVYNAWKSANNTNDANLSVNRFLKGNDLGYVVAGNTEVDSAVTPMPRPLKQDTVKVETQSYDNDETNKGWISLQDMLPFLRASIALPTNIYTHLRLVINWKSASELKDVVGSTTGARAFALSTYENTVLVADEMNASDTREQLMMNYAGVAYRPIEHDSVSIPPITGIAQDGTSAQETSNMVKGFNGKKLNTLLLVNTPAEQSTWVDSGTDSNKTSYANQGSKSLYQPQVQVRVNGANKLARNGLTGYNRRLGALVDAYGEVNLVVNQNVPKLADGSNYIDVDEIPDGQLDYTGLRVDDFIEELIVDVNRTGVDTNADLNQRVTLNLFGEVNKQVVMRKDGRYNIVYSS